MIYFISKRVILIPTVILNLIPNHWKYFREYLSSNIKGSIPLCSLSMVELLVGVYIVQIYGENKKAKPKILWILLTKTN